MKVPALQTCPLRAGGCTCVSRPTIPESTACRRGPAAPWRGKRQSGAGLASPQGLGRTQLNLVPLTLSSPRSCLEGPSFSTAGQGRAVGDPQVPPRQILSLQPSSTFGSRRLLWEGRRLPSPPWPSCRLRVGGPGPPMWMSGGSDPLNQTTYTQTAPPVSSQVASSPLSDHSDRGRCDSDGAACQHAALLHSAPLLGGRPAWGPPSPPFRTPAPTPARPGHPASESVCGLCPLPRLPCPARGPPVASSFPQLRLPATPSQHPPRTPHGKGPTFPQPRRSRPCLPAGPSLHAFRLLLIPCSRFS